MLPSKSIVAVPRRPPPPPPNEQNKYFAPEAHQKIGRRLLTTDTCCPWLNKERPKQARRIRIWVSALENLFAPLFFSLVFNSRACFLQICAPHTERRSWPVRVCLLAVGLAPLPSPQVCAPVTEKQLAALRSTYIAVCSPFGSGCSMRIM